MKRAYILVDPLIGSEDNVLKAVMGIPEVKEVHRIYDIYGLIVLVEAETIQEIDEVILPKIRGINGVQFVLKMICID